MNPGVVSNNCIQVRESKSNTYPGIEMLLFVVRRRDPLRTVPSASHNEQVGLEHSDHPGGHT